jgi:hypothetical protein
MKDSLIKLILDHGSKMKPESLKKLTCDDLKAMCIDHGIDTFEVLTEAVEVSASTDPTLALMFSMLMEDRKERQKAKAAAEEAKAKEILQVTKNGVTVSIERRNLELLQSETESDDIKAKAKLLNGGTSGQGFLVRAGSTLDKYIDRRGVATGITVIGCVTLAGVIYNVVVPAISSALTPA